MTWNINWKTTRWPSPSRASIYTSSWDTTRELDVVFPSALRARIYVVRELAAAGLDHATIRAALDREFEQSLGAAGVSFDSASLPRPSRRTDASPPLGTSVRLALERGLESGRIDHKLPAHLLLGIVLAPVGTVPRVLALAGVDRLALAVAIRRDLVEGTKDPAAQAG